MEQRYKRYRDEVDKSLCRLVERRNDERLMEVCLEFQDLMTNQTIIERIKNVKKASLSVEKISQKKVIF